MTIKGRRFYQTGVMTLADCGELCAYNKHPEQAVKRCTEILLHSTAGNSEGL